MRRMYILLAITALCLLDKPAVATPPAGDPPVTFRSDVSLGRVDAQVVDGENHPIRGLRAQDFILRVDGKPQEIRHFQSERMPVDVVLLLDVSRSMEPHIRRVASASHQALRALGDQDRIATMVFDRLTRLRMPFQLQQSGCRADTRKSARSRNFRGRHRYHAGAVGHRLLRRAERAARCTPGNCHRYRRSDRAQPKRSCGLACADTRRLCSERSDRTGCPAYGNRAAANIAVR